jgi:phosphoesterase RecJ-like protein
MMKRTEDLRRAWARLTEGRSFVLACHQRPDGDALGSALALARVLRAMGKDATVVSEDGVPELCSFIPESETVVTGTDRRDFDVGVLVDSEGAKRVGSAADAVRSARVTACIDHHLPDGEFGEIRIVDSTASSTAELLLALLQANDVSVDSVVATQLMAGLVNDTGAFRFANTSPETFRAAAHLMELGASPSAVAREIYESKPMRAMKLLGRALESLQTDPSGSVVWAVITQSDLREFGATDADTDSVVNVVSQVKGPSVAILLRETEPRSIRISLRSRDGVDVNQIARAFGGGGHAAAAGCTIARPLDAAREAVVAEVLKWMQS